MFLSGNEFDLLARLQTIKENPIRMLYRDLIGEIIVLLCISDRSWILRKSIRGQACSIHCFWFTSIMIISYRGLDRPSTPTQINTSSNANVQLAREARQTRRKFPSFQPLKAWSTPPSSSVAWLPSG